MSEERVDIVLGLKTSIEGLSETLSSLGEIKEKIVGLAVASSPAILIHENGELAAGIKALAGQTGISTDAFQALKYSMQEDAVAADDLGKVLVSLKKNLETAATDPKSPINDRLRDLKLDAAGLQAIAPERQLEVIGERLAHADDENAAFNAALELLGSKHAPKVIESLKRLYEEGFDKWEEKTRHVRLTKEQLDTLDEAGNKLQRLWDLIKLASARSELRAIDFLGGVQAPDGSRGFERMMAGNISAAQFRSGEVQALPEDPMHGRAFTPDAVAKEQRERDQEAAMAEASRKAAELNSAKVELELAVKEAQKAQKVLADMKEISPEADAESGRAAAQLNRELDTQADKFRDLIDPAKKYRDQIDEVELLQRAGKITTDEATAAIVRLKAEMGHDLEHAIDASNEALRTFERSLNGIADSPFLTDVEKQRERARIFREENAALQAQIDLLKKFADEHPGVEPTAIRSQIRSLTDRQVRNDKEIGKPDLAAAGVGDNLRAEVKNLENKLVTPAQNIARTITGTIGGAFDSAGQHAVALIKHTENWHQALAGIGDTIETQLITGIVKMFTEWIEQRALAGVASMLWSAKEGAADTAAKAPGAMLSSISSFGAAALIGAAALAAVMATVGGFSQGGYTGDIDTSAIAGVVHGREYVFDASSTDRIGRDVLDAMRFSASPVATLAASSAAVGSFAAPVASGGGRPTRFIHVQARDSGHARELARDPEFDNVMLDWAHRNRGEIVT